MPPSSDGRERLRLVSADETSIRQDKPMPQARRRQIDAVSDFERAAEKLPRQMVDDVRSRQQDVTNKRERAQVKEGLLRLRVRSRRSR